MTPMIIILIILVVLIAIAVGVKLVLRGKLQDIDGVTGIHKKSENVIDPMIGRR